MDRLHYPILSLNIVFRNTDKMAFYKERQQWVGPVDPCYRATVPIKESSSGQKLQCFLIDFLQTPLIHDPASPPPGWFLSSTVPETLLFHKRFDKTHEYISRYGIQFIPNLSDVEISIYIFKDKDLQVRGRMHYRIEALAVCFDGYGGRIMEPSGDSCMGFLAIQVRIVFLLICCFLPRRSCFGASMLK